MSSSSRAIYHRRTHNLLLLQNLLSLREGSSPFTLVHDTIEQTAKPLISRYIHNAKSSKTNIILVSFEALKPPGEINAFINGRKKDPSALQAEILVSCSADKRILIIIDTLHPLVSHGNSTSIIHFLLPLIAQPGLKTSLVAVYHDDIPVHPTQSIPAYTSYLPSPAQALNHLATTILTIHPLPQHMSRHLASERSLPEPVFGLAESREGVLVGISPNHPMLKDHAGFVLEMEHRRKSGRGVNDTFVLPLDPTSKELQLLEDHPAFKSPSASKVDEGEDAGEDFGGVTFDLGLTEKQRREREGVVLPYFDAQKRGRGEIDAEEGERGDGGRILYQMGREDDFDEEEDEI
ncbi:MAG: hypothetical protein OHK93_003725 [Ramalina farinacea]|uniref:Elongator complex protein 5 n=1 Tax=Ramalina farinacea TaxID=258253 RepID=A0AA43TUX4_9LECA|nr:hypothetical protein [Ramalina farinacea]